MAILAPPMTLKAEKIGILQQRHEQKVNLKFLAISFEMITMKHNCLLYTSAKLSVE